MLQRLRCAMSHLAHGFSPALRRPDVASCALRRRHMCAGAAEAAPATSPAPTALEAGGSRARLRVQLARWQQDALHVFWQAQGVRSAAHRDKLVALGSDMLLFRSPHDLSGKPPPLRVCCAPALSDAVKPPPRSETHRVATSAVARGWHTRRGRRPHGGPLPPSCLRRRCRVRHLQAAGPVRWAARHGPAAPD